MQPIVISAMSRKGGAGKTTLLRALASALVLNGKRVRLVDLDPNRALAAWVELATERGNSSPLLTVSETLLTAELDAIIDDVFDKESADYILMDTPGTGGQWADMIAMQSDLIVTPIILTRSDIARGMETISWYKGLHERTRDPADLPSHATVITRLTTQTVSGADALTVTQKQLALELGQHTKPVDYPLRERRVYQDMDNEGLLNVVAQKLKADRNPLARGRARRYDDALHESVTLTNALLGRLNEFQALEKEIAGE